MMYGAVRPFIGILAIISGFALFSCQSHKTVNGDGPNLITFSKIDKAQKMSTGKGVKIGILDWQFDMGKDAVKKYIDPVSMVPGENIGELKPWHGEWMAKIAHAVAPDAMIIPINARSLNRDDYEDYLIRGIYYAADHGATAVTSSMGPLTQNPRLDSAVIYAEQHGTIFVDVHPETIRIENQEPRLCTSDECNKIIIHTGVVSVPEHEVTLESNREIYTWPYDLEAVYEDGWGYSNSPPIVAGVMALIKSANPGLAPDDIRRLIKETAYDYNGFRCLDAEAAVKKAISLK